MKFKYVSQRTGLYTVFHLGERIGEGRSGAVYKVWSTRGPEKNIVCKVINTAELHPRLQELGITLKEKLNDTLKEIRILHQRGWLEGYTRQGDVFYIFMKNIEGCSVSFTDLNQKKSCFSAMRDCHRKNIAHGDIQEGNFIYSFKKKVRAIDFGRSQEATFINIFLDLLPFAYISESKKFLWTRIYNWLIWDYGKNFWQHKIRNVLFLAKWIALSYGALYGYPLFLSSSFFIEYLRTLIIHQLFLEIRTFVLMKKNTLLSLISLFAEETSHLKIAGWSKKIGNFLALFLVFIPIHQIQKLFQANNAWLTSIITALFQKKLSSLSCARPPSLLAVWQMLLLRYPLQELTYIAEDMLNAVQTPTLAKVRADLYFCYHPSLYAKAINNTYFSSTEQYITDRTLTQARAKLRKVN